MCESLVVLREVANANPSSSEKTRSLNLFPARNLFVMRQYCLLQVLPVNIENMLTCNFQLAANFPLGFTELLG